MMKPNYETLEFLLAEYDRARVEAKKVFDNPPPSDEHGRWPLPYVGSVKRAEANCEERLAALGRFLLAYRYEILEIIPDDPDEEGYDD